MHYYSLRPTCTILLPHAIGTETQLCEQSQQKLVAMATSFELDRKPNFKLIIYNHTSTNPVNLANMGTEDFEINRLMEVVKRTFF